MAAISSMCIKLWKVKACQTFSHVVKSLMSHAMKLDTSKVFLAIRMHHNLNNCPENGGVQINEGSLNIYFQAVELPTWEVQSSELSEQVSMVSGAGEENTECNIADYTKASFVCSRQVHKIAHHISHLSVMINLAGNQRTRTIE